MPHEEAAFAKKSGCFFFLADWYDFFTKIRSLAKGHLHLQRISGLVKYGVRM